MGCLIHSWNKGCTCIRCGAVRDEKHVWNGCTCVVCGKNRGEQYHKWNGWGTIRSNGCTCEICGATRDSRTIFFGGKHREEDCHHYESVPDTNNMACVACGKTYDRCSRGNHEYVRDNTAKCTGKCKWCGVKTSRGFHTIVTNETGCISTCTVCGYTTAIHRFSKDVGSPNEYVYQTFRTCLDCGAPNPDYKSDKGI